MCQDRPGGYTRILRDAKQLASATTPRCAIFEFVDRAVDEDEDEAPKKGEEEEVASAARGAPLGRRARLG